MGKSKPIWEINENDDRRTYRLQGTKFYILQPKTRAFAKSIALIPPLKYRVYEDSGYAGVQDSYYGAYSKLADAKGEVMAKVGRALEHLKLTQRQARAIARYENQGYKVLSGKRPPGDKSIAVTVERNQHWDFPEWCPYARWKYESSELILTVSPNGVVEEKLISYSIIYWACDYPQAEPNEPQTKIYRGTHPLLPIRSTEQLGLAL